MDIPPSAHIRGSELTGSQRAPGIEETIAVCRCGKAA